MRWKTKNEIFEMIWKWITEWNGEILSAFKRWTWNHDILFQDTYKYEEKKQKIKESNMKWATDENELWDENTTPGQNHESVQKEKED